MSQLRVSVATYNQVIFPHPENGTPLLALERKATAGKDGSVHIRAQPFGGGVRILDSASLEGLLGGIQFDSERSEQEQDFRILIHPSQWDVVKQYCLLHLKDPHDPELESTPDRELVEEFEETMHVDLSPDQYTVQPMGFVIEDHPLWTENWYARGYPTVRVYLIHQVRLLDQQLCRSLLFTSQQISNHELGMQAMKSDTGRANSALALPFKTIEETYLALPSEERYTKIKVGGHELDESVLAVLNDVDVLQYQRV